MARSNARRDCGSCLLGVVLKQERSAAVLSNKGQPALTDPTR